MNNIPLAFQSPVLAQRKLLDKFALKKQHCVDYDIIDENPCADTMTNIATIPSLGKVLQAPESSADTDLKSIGVRSYKRAYERYLNSDSGRETLAKAVKYNIPFDKNDIDFLDLTYKIAEYECQIEKAAELGTQWDQSNYDTVELQDEIEGADVNAIDGEGHAASCYDYVEIADYLKKQQSIVIQEKRLSVVSCYEN